MQVQYVKTILSLVRNGHEIALKLKGMNRSFIVSYDNICKEYCFMEEDDTFTLSVNLIDMAEILSKLLVESYSLITYQMEE